MTPNWSTDQLRQYVVNFESYMPACRLQPGPRCVHSGVFCTYAGPPASAEIAPDISSVRLLYVGHSGNVYQEMRSLVQQGFFSAHLGSGEWLWFTLAHSSLHDKEVDRERVAKTLIHAYAPPCNEDDQPYPYSGPTGVVTGENNWGLCNSFTACGHEQPGFLRCLKFHPGID